jgi:hypothetical protein
MLHHGWLVASSLAIAAQGAPFRKGPLGSLVCTSGWTIAAALWCASSWTLGFLQGGSSPTQRLAHLAMHASAVGAIATLARDETRWGVLPLA